MSKRRSASSRPDTYVDNEHALRFSALAFRRFSLSSLSISTAGHCFDFLPALREF